jgi:hypothetical protein
MVDRPIRATESYAANLTLVTVCKLLTKADIAFSWLRPSEVTLNGCEAFV